MRHQRVLLFRSRRTRSGLANSWEIAGLFRRIGAQRTVAPDGDGAVRRHGADPIVSGHVLNARSPMVNAYLRPYQNAIAHRDDHVTGANYRGSPSRQTTRQPGTCWMATT